MSALHWQDVDAYHTPESIRREFRPEDALDRRPLLDTETEPHPILSALMDEALLRITLTSDGRAMALTERISGSHAGTLAPTSDLATELDQLSSRFMRCKTHRARLYAIKDAQAVADRLCYAPDRSVIRGTVEWRQAIAKDARSCRVLASIHGVNASTISRIKKQARAAA